MDWSRYQEAVARWEQVFGFSAPKATIPDGPNGEERLNPELPEWMMGLDPGWITNRGLTRREELKMTGNGVVRQQARYAIQILLESLESSTQ
jgi:DNA (cytosine-5)-methyltransferase 1